MFTEMYGRILFGAWQNERHVLVFSFYNLLGGFIEAQAALPGDFFAVPGRFYVTATSAGTLYAGQRGNAANTISWQRDLGQPVNGLAASEDQRLVFAGLPTSSSIAVVDAPTGRLLGKAPLGAAPGPMLATPTGTLLVMAGDDLVVVSPTRVSPPAPRVLGRAQVGRVLRASTSGWPTGTSLHYQWRLDGRPIVGATGASFHLAKGCGNRRVSVTVTGSSETLSSTSATSAPTAGVLPDRIASTRPRIIGRMTLHSTVRVRTGAWSPGTSFTYAWLANGKPISGARGPRLRIGRALLGKRLSVRVTGHLADLPAKTATSAPRPVPR